MSEMWSTLSPNIAYVALALVALGYALYRSALPKPLPGIPYSQTSSQRLLGDAPDMVEHMKVTGTVFDWWTAQGAKLQTPVYQLFLKPFSRPVVVVLDPKEAHDILYRRSKEFDRSRYIKDGFSGTVPYSHIVQSTNDKFRSNRRIVADTMTTGFLHTVAAPHLHRNALNLFELWSLKTELSAGHAFSVDRDLNHFALDAIWEVAFGGRLNSIPDEIAFLKSLAKQSQFHPPQSQDAPANLPKPGYNPSVEAMFTITKGLDAAFSSPMPRLTHWFLRMTPNYRAARAHKHKLVHERLNDAKARMLGLQDAEGEFTGMTCATDFMVKREAQAAAKEGRTPVFDSREAMDELFAFLIGGHETTATTLTWAVKFLSDNPAAQTRLREALRAAYAVFEVERGEVPTVEALTGTRVPYLDAVVEEVTRCANTSSGAMREATRDTELLGYRIPKGTDVYLMSNGPGYNQPNHLNETISDAIRSQSSRDNKDKIGTWNAGDVGQFKPERWLRLNEDGKEEFDAHSGPVMQFGGGIRGCFGRKLAYVEMRILLTLLVWNFELLQVPEKLRSYASSDGLTHKPQQCYVLLKDLRKAQ